MYWVNLPACSRAAGMANAGPIPMTSGGTPTTALALRTPRTGRPRASTADLRPISTAAAPSLTWLELPETGRVEHEWVSAERRIGSPVGPGPRRTCRGAAVSFEGRPQFAESRQSRSRSDPIILSDGHLALFALVVHQLGGDGNDLLLEHTGVLRPGRSAGGTGTLLLKEPFLCRTFTEVRSENRLDSLTSAENWERRRPAFLWTPRISLRRSPTWCCRNKEAADRINKAVLQQVWD